MNTTFIDPNPHAFHMFENFELNRKIFVEEQEVVKLMRAVRKDINNIVLKIEQGIKKLKYIDNDNSARSIGDEEVVLPPDKPYQT